VIHSLPALIPIDCGTLAAGNLVLSAAAFAIAVAVQLRGQMSVACGAGARILSALAVYGLAGVIALHFLGPAWSLLLPFLLGLAVTFAVTRLFEGLAFNGGLLMAAHAQFYLACLLWGLTVIAMADVDPLTRSLMCIGLLLALLYVSIALVQRLEQMELICRQQWRSPSMPASGAAHKPYPKISVHVPICCEPADLVMATLDGLAALHYPDYEVLVVDNNTVDPSLWRPVEAHCQRLGERFRFFHVDDLAGGKAGALNFALRHTDSAAALISVVDSDYIVTPDFLTSLVSFFDDPSMGFVQSPQAYRGWEHYPYLRMCNWEYTLYLVGALVIRNERMAAITLGTMGLIRREALEEIGGWAEWSVTEDSELALRIHAQGYKSAYISTAFGRGLIPETFRAYKRQRFRWCFGAIQEFRRHFRLLLPYPLAQPSPLSAAQKISHLMHALDTMKSGLEFLMLVVGAMLVGCMLLQQQSVQVPGYVWMVFSAGLLLACTLRWHVFRTLGWTLRDILGATLAHAALEHTIAMASFWALMTKNTSWRKTDKFRARPGSLWPFAGVRAELLLGGGMLIAGAVALRANSGNGLLLLLAAGLLKATKYLLAPVLVMLAEYGIRQRTAELPCGAKNSP
jgi:hypothetical protein